LGGVVTYNTARLSGIERASFTPSVHNLRFICIA
jgi:hypothetical protein